MGGLVTEESAVVAVVGFAQGSAGSCFGSEALGADIGALGHSEVADRAVVGMVRWAV